MGRTRSNTIQSFVAHHETYVFSTQTNTETGERRWACAINCDSTGEFGRDRPATLVNQWNEHLRRDHPDADVFTQPPEGLT